MRHLGIQLGETIEVTSKEALQEAVTGQILDTTPRIDFLHRTTLINSTMAHYTTMPLWPFQPLKMTCPLYGRKQLRQKLFRKDDRWPRNNCKFWQRSVIDTTSPWIGWRSLAYPHSEVLLETGDNTHFTRILESILEQDPRSYRMGKTGYKIMPKN